MALDRPETARSPSPERFCLNVNHALGGAEVGISESTFCDPSEIFHHLLRSLVKALIAGLDGRAGREDIRSGFRRVVVARARAGESAGRVTAGAARTRLPAALRSSAPGFLGR